MSYHTDAEDLLNLYNNGIIPNGQSYGIRKRYNFACINKEDIDEITRNIAESYNFDAESIRNWLQELGLKPGDLLELDIALELARGNRNDGLGLGASGRSGREVDADRSSSTSGKDKGEVLEETEEDDILYRTVNSHQEVFVCNAAKVLKNIKQVRG